MFVKAIWKNLDRSIRRDALWCGMLGAAISIILMLNVFPPQIRGIRTIAYVLMSQSRLDELRSLPGGLDKLGIESIAPIKQTNTSASENESNSETDFHHWVVQVSFLSDETLDRNELRAELSESTEGAVHYVRDDATSKTIRKLKWQQRSLEHVAQVNASKLDKPELRSNFHFASTGNAPSVRLVDEESTAEIDRSLQAIENELTRLHAERLATVSNSIGDIQVATNMESRVLFEKLDWFYAFMLLIVGISGYGGFAWLYLKLQSRRTPKPDEIVQWLKNQGVNPLGTLWVMSEKSESKQSRASVPRLATGVKEILEITLLLIVLAGCLRVCLDPAWRSLCSDNLLFALGRIFWH